ncbi:MAG: hypothetical protein AAB257_02270 [Nitrospinota bacterium]
MKKLFMVVAGLLVISLISGCAFAMRIDDSYKGKVIDAETKQPIKGVVVLAIWYREKGNFRTLYDVMEIATDTNGEYEIPGKGLLIMSNILPVRTLIFKASYEHIGIGSWISLKGNGLSKSFKMQGDKAIIPLKKLTMEERQRRGAPVSYLYVPAEKIKLLMKEIEKERIDLGLMP